MKQCLLSALTVAWQDTIGPLLNHITSGQSYPSGAHLRYLVQEGAQCPSSPQTARPSIRAAHHINANRASSSPGSLSNNYILSSHPTVQIDRALL